MIFNKYQFINYDCVVKQRQEDDEKKKNKKCEQCGYGYAQVVHAMTRYPWKGEGENPNRDLLLCDYHKQEYEDHWKEMWKDYYSGVM